ERTQKDLRGVENRANAEESEECVRARRNRQAVDSGISVARVEEIRNRIAFAKRIEDSDVAGADGQIQIAVVVHVSPVRSGDDRQRRSEQRVGVCEHASVVLPQDGGTGEFFTANEKVGIVVIVEISEDSANRSQSFVDSGS